MIKRLIFSAFLLVTALPASATLTFVQAQQNSAASATAVTVTISSTANNLLVICTAEGANTTSTVAITDSASQTWTQSAAGYSSGSAAQRTAIWFMPNSAAVTSVTATWSGSLSTGIDAVIFEFSGGATSSAEDTSINNFQAAGTTATSGTFSTTNAHDVLVFGVKIGGSFSSPTAGAGYTIPTNGTSNRIVMEYQIVSSTQSSKTATLSWTSSKTNENAFIALKAAAGGAAPTGMNRRQKYEQMDPQRR